MLQATLSDRLFLDHFPFAVNVFIAAKVDVGGCYVFQALVEALIVVVVDEAQNFVVASISFLIEYVDRNSL